MPNWGKKREKVKAESDKKQSDFLPGKWKKCTNLNRGKPCAANHSQHKKSFGSWYGRVG